MFERVMAAREPLRRHANRTPVVTSRALNRWVGAGVFFKCEDFQRVGAFRFRGAFNAIVQLTATEENRARGSTDP